MAQVQPTIQFADDAFDALKATVDALKHVRVRVVRTPGDGKAVIGYPVAFDEWLMVEQGASASGTSLFIPWATVKKIKVL